MSISPGSWTVVVLPRLNEVEAIGKGQVALGFGVQLIGLNEVFMGRCHIVEEA